MNVGIASLGMLSPGALGFSNAMSSKVAMGFSPSVMEQLAESQRLAASMFEGLGQNLGVSAIQNLGQLSVGALGFADAMSSMSSKVAMGFSPSVMEQLAESQRLAASMFEDFGKNLGAVAMADLGIPSVNATFNDLRSTSLHDALGFVDSLRAGSLLSVPVEDLEAAHDYWRSVENEARAARAELAAPEGLGYGVDAAALGAFFALAIAVASSSDVLVVIASNLLVNALGILHVLLQVASEPAISNPIGTAGGAIAIVQASKWSKRRD